MNLDPELLAAAYLEGLPADARARYEEHLLTCEACWCEVSLARRGRALAESVRDLTPAGIREDIRAAAAAADQRPPATPHRRRRLAGSVAAVLLFVMVAGGALVWRPWEHQSAPIAAPSATTAPRSSVPPSAPRSTLTAAVASFLADRLPGTAVPAVHPPDLTRAGLHLVGAAAGVIDGSRVTVFAYRTRSGGRLDVYRSAQPIPEAGEAHELEGAEDAWRSTVGGVSVICGPASHTVLVIGSDRLLVDHVGTLLAIV